MIEVITEWLEANMQVVSVDLEAKYVSKANCGLGCCGYYENLDLDIYDLETIVDGGNVAALKASLEEYLEDNLYGTQSIDRTRVVSPIYKEAFNNVNRDSNPDSNL